MVVLTMKNEIQAEKIIMRYIKRNSILFVKVGLVSVCILLVLYLLDSSQKKSLTGSKNFVNVSCNNLKLIMLVFLKFILQYSFRHFGNRTFKINAKKKQFEMNGKPFRYVSGSFHYFRAMPQTWQRKLRTMRAAGLNAVST